MSYLDPAEHPELLGLRGRVRAPGPDVRPRPTAGPCPRTCSSSRAGPPTATTRATRCRASRRRPEGAETNASSTARPRSTRGPTSRGCSTEMACRGATTSRPVPARSRRAPRRRSPAGTPPSPKNPLPGFATIYETGQQDHILDHDGASSGALGTGRCPSVSWVVPGDGVERAPRQSSRGIAAGMAHVTRIVNAVMRGPDWEQLRDLPHLGRLGRLLRPRRAAARRRERVRPPGARAPHQPVRPARVRSTTRRSRSTRT